jgi:hypothetical protein
VNKQEQRERALRDNRLAAIGFDWNEIESITRIERTLHRWAELECGTDRGAIERDETTGKPYFMMEPPSRHGRSSWPVRDMETGALKRLSAIMANHPELWSYHQSDPRGCALYIGRNEDKATRYPEHELDSVYSSIGIAI